MECDLAPASPEDARALARLAARTLSEAWSEVGLREALEQGVCRALAARDAGGNVRGFVLGRHVLTESQILLVVVEPGWQGHGLGRRMLEDYLARARSEGAITATLEVRSSNRGAQAVYERLGFVTQGQRPGFYADGEDALLMGVGL